MKLYRVCTENKNHNYNDILDYLDKYFPDGYTIFHANGAWQGTREKSLVIEIIASHDHEIKQLVYWLKKHNSQQAVMVQDIEIGCWLFD